MEVCATHNTSLKLSQSHGTGSSGVCFWKIDPAWSVFLLHVQLLLSSESTRHAASPRCLRSIVGSFSPRSGSAWSSSGRFSSGRSTRCCGSDLCLGRERSTPPLWLFVRLKWRTLQLVKAGNPATRVHPESPSFSVQCDCSALGEKDVRFRGQDCDLSLLNERFCAPDVTAHVRYLENDVDGTPSVSKPAAQVPSRMSSSPVADAHLGKSAASPIGTRDAQSGG